MPLTTQLLPNALPEIFLYKSFYNEIYQEKEKLFALENMPIVMWTLQKSIAWVRVIWFVLTFYAINYALRYNDILSLYVFTEIGKRLL